MRWLLQIHRQSGRGYRGAQYAECSGGFTLVELMVTVAIATIITSITLINHSQFTSQTVLTNLAYEILGSIRLAQTYGISVRGSTLAAADFDSGYGIHFSSAQGYVLFEDTDNDDTYDGSGEALRAFQLQNGHRIAEFCGRRTASGTTHCSTGTLNYLDVTFERPEPDATFVTNTGVPYDEVWIDVSAAQGSNTRRVRITPTGHLSVETP